MTRKKQEKPETTDGESATAAAVALPEAPAEEEGLIQPAPRQWANPYKAIFVSKDKGFEMGENRRFGQRVFMFKEKPGEEILAALKEAGFTYRAGEKAWTIPATAQTRRVSDELARSFAGHSAGMSR